MYVGLGLMTRSSGGKLYYEKLTTDYNRSLKYNLKQAAETTIHSEDNLFRGKCLDMTLLRGIAPNLAKLTGANHQKLVFVVQMQGDSLSTRNTIFRRAPGFYRILTSDKEDQRTPK
jgi:hypothetical protein